ncbi:hypothetical protein BGZ89_006748 [Linnemannia elongata]|nr:hypothetical protein BGZ89_006748 [Linnemannia elongata]
MNNNPNGVGAARKLQTHWRVTDFDLEKMRVEFQLEEKLGLEMAERRRWEVEYQTQQQLLQQGRKKEQSETTRLGLQGLGQGEEEEDIENLIWRTRTGGISSSSSTSSLTGVLGTGARGGAGSQQSHTPTLGSATVSFKAQRNMPAPWISQHFDFADHSTLKSPPASASASSSTSSAPTETTAVIRARERVAAYQQNRLLLRALAKMRSCEESSKPQFLPVAVELETEELGQKKVEAELLDGITAGVRRRTYSGYGKVSVVSASVGQGAKLGRRHSWQALRPPADRVYGTGSGVGVSSAQHPHQHHHHHSTLEPLLNFGNDLSSSGWTKALKRILKRTSWNGNGSPRSRAHTAPPISTTSAVSSTSTTGCSVCDPQHYQYHHHHNQQQQQPQRRSMDSLRTVDWTSVFHSVTSSMHRSSSSSASSHSATTATSTTSGEACQCQRRKAVLLTTSKQQDHSTAAPVAAAAIATTSTTLVAKRRSFSNVVAGYRKGKTSPSSSSDRSTAASSTVDKGKGKGKSKAITLGLTPSPSSPSSSSSSEQEQDRQTEESHQKLFEFSYGVRHNYLHSHRLEGERVIRPMRFACSLDFFIQD